MARVLKPTTIVDPSLYVERDADRQLERIVNDMGRPAYVLEARQMGKTNLLLHMKRKQESLGKFVLYHDLSVKTSDARSFFRSLLDPLIDTLQSDELNRSISAVRSEHSADSHREFDRSLRLILASLAQRELIIILDEVDSIVTAPYSDTLFAQIRSMYFSRVTYAEYGRLTYVLSGVAEPTELIKDKSISPFNIGDKVVLHDFTKHEVADFLKRAGLHLEDKAFEQFYRLTGGNPRMTWDIASKLEEAGELHASADDIRTLAEALYLYKFDRPPVDHIRTLAEKDSALRSAVSSVRWGAGQTVDPKTIGRLYLAGIINFDNSGSPYIKNDVIDRALSDQWLLDISEREKGILRAASDEFASGRWKSAIRLFINNRDKAAAPETVETRIQLGLSYFYAGEYEAASSEFKFLLSMDIRGDLMSSIHYYYGLSLAHQGDFAAAIALLRLAASSQTRTQPIATAALMSTLYQENRTENLREVLDLEASINWAALEEADKGRIHASVGYTIACAYQESGDPNRALERLDAAKALAPSTTIPTLLMRQYLVARDSRTSSLVDAKNIVLREKWWPDVAPSELDLSDRRAVELAALLAHTGDNSGARQILSMVSSLRQKSTYSVILEALRSVSADVYQELALLIDVIFEDVDLEIPLEDRLEALRFQIENGGTRFRSEATKNYIALAQLIARQGLQIKQPDGLFLLSLAVEQSTEGRNNRAIATVELVLRLVTGSGPDQLFLRLFAKQQEMVIAERLSDMTRSRAAAREILSTYADNQRAFESLSTDLGGFVRSATAAAQRTLRQSPFPLPRTQLTEMRQLKGIGRNERVEVRDNETGEVRVSKFKLVDNDIRSGRLTLVSKP